MGAQVRYGSIAVGAYSAHQPGSHQRAFTDQYTPKWDRGYARSPKTQNDPTRWYSCWSFGCRVGFGTPIGTDGAGWIDCSKKDLFEPYSCDGPGCSHARWIKGVCVDSVDAVVANAIVQCFRTTDDVFTHQVTAGEDGTYTVATFDQTGAVQHYLVAYKAGSPDIAGTTVNTLLSTHIDGS